MKCDKCGDTGFIRLLKPDAQSINDLYSVVDMRTLPCPYDHRTETEKLNQNSS